MAIPVLDEDRGTKPIMLYLSPDLIDRIDRFKKQASRLTPGGRFSRTSVVRWLLQQALDAQQPSEVK